MVDWRRGNVFLCWSEWFQNILWEVMFDVLACLCNLCCIVQYCTALSVPFWAALPYRVLFYFTGTLFLVGGGEVK